MNINKDGGINFSDYMALKRKALTQVKAREIKTRASIVKHNLKPALMIANGGNMQNIISACIEGGYYKESHFEKRMKRPVKRRTK